MDIISGEQILFIIRRVYGVDWSHVFAGESGLVNRLKGVLDFLQFWHIHILASRLPDFLEALLKQLPHLYVPLVRRYQLLVLALPTQPLHVIYCLRDLLTFEGVELPAMGLKFCIVFQIFCFFLWVLLQLKNDHSSCMVTKRQILATFVEGHLRNYILFLDFLAGTFVPEHLGQFVVSWRAAGFRRHYSFLYEVKFLFGINWVNLIINQIASNKYFIMVT